MNMRKFLFNFFLFYQSTLSTPEPLPTQFVRQHRSSSSSSSLPLTSAEAAAALSAALMQAVFGQLPPLEPISLGPYQDLL
jgi:hypothetical protein